MVCDGRGRQPSRVSLSPSLSLSRHVDSQYRNLPSIRRGALTGRDRERHRGGPSSNGMISNKNSNIPLWRIQAAVLFFTDINVFSASFIKPTLLSLPCSASSARAGRNRFISCRPRPANPIQSNPIRTMHFSLAHLAARSAVTTAHTPGRLGHVSVFLF